MSSVADLLTRPVTWTLISQDDGTELSGDFPGQNVVENVEGNWSEQSTLGLDQPILQFMGGKLDTITLDVKVWAKHRGILGTGLLADDIEDKVNTIRNLARKDPDLGRPHVWLFSIGTQLLQRVVVRKVGGINYDRFRDDGSLRGALFAFELARYEPYSITGLAEAESLVTPVKQGDTYEMIARRVHGDPLLGEALRRRNPDKRLPQPGDLIHVPSRKILRQEVYPLTPQSLFLKDGTAQRTNLVDAFAARGGPALSHLLSEDWS
jgi:hypothetical protein